MEATIIAIEMVVTTTRTLTVAPIIARVSLNTIQLLLENKDGTRSATNGATVTN